jgi:hypothetical protein
LEPERWRFSVHTPIKKWNAEQNRHVAVANGTFTKRFKERRKVSAMFGESFILVDAVFKLTVA